MFRILRVTADAPSILFLNGQCAGELPAVLPIGGETLLQAFPLADGRLPVSAKLTPGEPVQLTAPDSLSAYLLPDGQIHAVICYACITQEIAAMPYIVKRLPLGEGSAAVYFDRTFCFSLEYGGKVVVGGAFRNALQDAQIDRHGNFFCFRGIHAGGVELVLIDRSGAVLLHRDASEVVLGEQFAEYTRSCGNGVFLRERFTFAERKSVLREAFCREKASLAALATAVRENARELALSLMHPSLRREADFSDLCAFLGDFCALYPTDAPQTVGLCYEAAHHVYTVRLLHAGIREEQIVNIEENEQ